MGCDINHIVIIANRMRHIHSDFEIIEKLILLAVGCISTRVTQ